MKVLFCQSILTGMLILFITSGARAAARQPVGFGSGNGSSKFRVFIYTDSIQATGRKVRYWQGHVFYDKQQLPSGESYMRV
jgi:hypothetical protein